MAKLSDKQKETLIAMSLEVDDNDKPKYTQQELADKFDISKGMVNRYVKKKKDISKQIIDDEVRIIWEMQNLQDKKSKHLSKQEQIEVNKQVYDRVRRQEKFEGNAEESMDKISVMIQQVDTPNDIFTLTKANDQCGLSLGLVNRHAKQGDVNVQTNSVSNANTFVDIENSSPKQITNAYLDMIKQK